MANNESVAQLQLTRNRLQNQIHSLIVSFQADTGLIVTDVDIDRHVLVRMDHCDDPFDVLVKVSLP